ncbi:hypothetical protein ACFOEK_19980 [Litoribrevibacter euphylliae]|uniref:Uncharacterized protein n=1 Tax=Litoribrevibacter euphylliae TaxID=1834034 RepID=A0ABV7HHJ2_9GAMM
MSFEDPEQFELTTLEELLKYINQPESYNAGKWCAVFGVLGVFLLVAVYLLHMGSGLSSYWLYFLCVLGGISLGGSAIINRLSNQSKLLVQYFDKEAINKRITELKM